MFKQDIIISCKNMMSTAQNAIISNPNIKSVTVAEHPPRFDTADTAPLSIKPELAIFANSVFRQLWFESPLKHKIVLAQHKLDCSDATRQDRYTDRKSKRYDGVHMYGESGKKAYTTNVLSIVSACIATQRPGLRPRQDNYHRSCPQTKYRNEQINKKKENRYSVPVQNRFNVLGN